VELEKNVITWTPVDLSFGRYDGPGTTHLIFVLYLYDATFIFQEPLSVHVITFFSSSTLSELLLTEIERVLQSNEQFVLDHCVQLNITHVRLPKGGTGKRCDYVDTVSDILPGIVETFLHLRFRIDVGVLPPWCVIPTPTLLERDVITWTRRGS
jgi:hypothetical protein